MCYTRYTISSVISYLFKDLNLKYRMYCEMSKLNKSLSSKLLSLECLHSTELGKCYRDAHRSEEILCKGVGSFVVFNITRKKSSFNGQLALILAVPILWQMIVWRNVSQLKVQIIFLEVQYLPPLANL